MALELRVTGAGQCFAHRVLRLIDHFVAGAASCACEKRNITSIAFSGGDIKRLRKSNFSSGPRMLRLGIAVQV
jgi:hypothetical protein